MTATQAPWKVLVVDDEEGIHGITRMIFRGYEFEQRPIELISAMSGAQAREMLAQHPDIALILLDVVMETDNAGLQLVEHIRHQLENRHVRIILRTGHPGYAPEADVIVNYDINDYLSKAELSASRLLTAVVVALRAYRDIDAARRQCEQHAPQATQDNSLLNALGQQLQQQAAQLLRQTERLQRLELSPMAEDMARDLLSLQQRMHNSCQLFQPGSSAQRQPLQLAHLSDQLISTFLPQARREGWLLDSHLAEHLPQQIQSSPAQLQQLLITALELAVLRANGDDLKISFQHASQPEQLLVHIQQTSGQPDLANTPWHNLLSERLPRLCEQLGGSWLSDDDSGIRFRVAM